MIERAVGAFIDWWSRRNRKVARRLDQLYERRGAASWRTVAGCVTAATLGMWWGVLVVTAFCVNMSVGDFAAAGIFVSACIVVTIAWITIAERRGSGRPVWDWLERGRPEQGASEAWRAAVDLPFVVIARMAPLRALLVVCVPLGLFVRFALGHSWLHAVASAAGLTAVLPVALVLDYFLLELGLGPVRRDAGRRGLARPGAVQPTSSMRWRMLVALDAIGTGTAVLASLVAQHGPVTVTMIAVYVPIAVIVAGTAAFGLSMLFTETIVAPLDELVDATKAIRAGDLSTRVPVVSADELGALSSSFNEMAADLQSARERLISAREEERRRLRRDLHDGLGPALAALVMQLELAGELLERDRAGAGRLIAELKAQAQDAIADVRRVVYELRPPALDELGLIGAIREHATRLTAAGNGNAVAVTLEAPTALPHLPAAVEVAALRIVQEAVTNLVRHARASSCRIAIAMNGGLELEVRDDGHGIAPHHHPGVGLASMRERASELGGTCTVRCAPEGGTVVHAHLPIGESPH